ncbi:flavin reductase family protein [Actinomadura syzygii]|uniref:Flavin reductase family protein n=1 Tax=Actinomadura syzygii TaxID=1427538 RepID=A0A5D0TVK6_9ACTN|nr:flavin reductase family protein [Actinomadura syzygii]TYC10301.1 flavin reductase family protein [Actinomadura syzygii]
MTTSTRPARLDPASLKAVLGHFATGVAAVTGLYSRAPVGLIVDSFTAVSLAPPLISFCVAHTSTTWPRMRSSEGLCVTFLAAEQLDRARRLATSGAAKFHGVPWTPSPAGLPVIDGGLAWLECEIDAEHPAGDHVIVVARVHRLAHANTGADPLLRYSGNYGRFTDDLEDTH